MRNQLKGFDVQSLDKIVAMQPDAKIVMIKEALYSDENLLKIVVKIMMIVDPDSIHGILDWLKAKSLDSSALDT
jgi:hypothetical protein